VEEETVGVVVVVVVAPTPSGVDMETLGVVGAEETSVAEETFVVVDQHGMAIQTHADVVVVDKLDVQEATHRSPKTATPGFTSSSSSANRPSSPPASLSFLKNGARKTRLASPTKTFAPPRKRAPST